MSSFLYGLGRAAVRHRVAVALSWLAVLVGVLALAGAVGTRFDEKFALPGTESQTALDSLNRNFPQAAGVTAQVIVVAPPGTTVGAPAVRSSIEAGTKAFAKIDHVEAATSPYGKYAKGQISDDASAAIITLRLATTDGKVPDATIEALDAETVRLEAQTPGSTASIGGEAYNNNAPGFSLVEVLGVLVAMAVLWLTLGSLRAAGLPLLTALLGVAITVVAIFATTGLTEVSSTTPLLAVMLGLAVGIDYALFITSRHRDQLADGLEPEESTARAVATAGSAVVFAGLTVMIALVGLSVAGIPFLTTMGVAAAFGVAIAVVIALTLLPALLGFAGDRLRPKPRARNRRREPVRPSPPRPAGGGAPRRWVRIVTKWPALTIAVVVLALGVMTYPAKDLRLALPSNGQANPGTPARTTYDLVSEHFGVGYNGPLIVSATIVGSDDPLGVMDGLAAEIRKLPGVASVPVSTPNANAEFGIVQVIPTTAPDAQETKDLVMRLRGMKEHFQDKYAVPVAVTGYTAVGIDVSDRLGGALLPFGVIVVGLSLLLLTMVFRSVAVPLKATIGYLLSVGSAFGATAVVFEWGWFGGVFNVQQTAPVISFLPILLMGILFGLAMDYEVFLVSRIREDFVHAAARTGTASRARAARAAISNGFAASARVVVAAAVIMFSVFAAFVPEGEGPIKTIAFGLAVGVFVDAFVVRMTLVPAVLALLGRSAWWLPRWIDRRLPSFDVEGEGLAHQVSLADWPGPDDNHVLAASGLRLAGRSDEVSVALRRGEILVVEGAPDSGKSALLLTLAGRMRLLAGTVKVAGLVLPEQAGALRRRTAVVDCAATRSLAQELRAVRAQAPAVIFVDHADVLAAPADRAALVGLLTDVARGGVAGTVVLAVRDRNALADLMPTSYSYLTLGASADRVLSRTN